MEKTRRITVHVGGKLVDKPVFIDVTLDCSEITLEDAFDIFVNASSPRVKLQGKLRQLSQEKLNKLAKEGCVVNLKKLYEAKQPKPKKVVHVATLREALQEFPVVEDFLAACRQAGWTELATEKQLTEKHRSFWNERAIVVEKD